MRIRNQRQRILPALCATFLCFVVVVTFRGREQQELVHPVLFVHGLGGNGRDWLEDGYFETQEQGKTLNYIGDIRIENGVAKCLELANLGHKQIGVPCLTISIANGATGSIPESASEVAIAIDAMKSAYGTDKVILVGSSLGGVICRELITGPDYKGDVDLLITISSPHCGTEYAYMYDMRESLLVLDQHENPIISRLARETIRQLDWLAEQTDIDIGCTALSMLRPPSAGNYLYLLNRRPHPQAVGYSCIVTNKSLPTISLRDLARDLRAKQAADTSTFTMLSDGVRQFLGLIEGGDLTFSGDGYVSETSQDLRNVDYFQQHPDLFIDKRTVSAGHTQKDAQRDLVKLIITQHLYINTYAS